MKSADTKMSLRLLVKVQNSVSFRAKDALRPPIVIDKMPPDSALVLQETFAPIAPIIRVPDTDDALIQITNSTRLGLSWGVCNNDLHRATGFIDGLEVGTCNIWEQPGYRTVMSPFGGVKDSGNGVKEGV